MSGFGDSTTGSGGPKYTGFAMVGPPFSFVKEFRQLEGDWAGGRISAVVNGTIIKPMPQAVVDFDGNSHHMPDEAVGELVYMFLEHPLKNHIPDVDDADGYGYRAMRWDRFGRPWPEFWTRMLLAKAGAGTKGLTFIDDDERLMKEILALLNAGPAWPLAMWESKTTGIEMERQIPPGTEVLAQFHQFLYYDHVQKRPTWIKYDYEYEGKKRVFRDVTFLLRVVAPSLWAGTILRLSVNYTIFHGRDESGNDEWQKPPQAVFGDVMAMFGWRKAISSQRFPKNCSWNQKSGKSPTCLCHWKLP